MATLVHAAADQLPIEQRPAGALTLPASLPVLTGVTEIRQLSPADADKAYPVRLQAEVTSYEPESGRLFVQDQTGGVAVFPLIGGLALRPGDRVVVDGVTHSGTFLPIVSGATVAKRAGAGKPRTKKALIDQIDPSAEDCNLLDVSGVVRSFSAAPSGTVLTLVENEKRLHVSIRGPAPTNYTEADWVGVTLQVKGICTHYVDPPRGFAAAQLTVPGWGFVQGQPRVSNWDDFAITPLAEITRSGFVRTQGTVREPNNFGGVPVADGNAVVRVRRGRAPWVQVGDRVDLLGFIDVTPRGLAFDEAICRIIGKPLDATIRSNAPIRNYLPLVTDAASVRSLTHAEARRGYPVRFVGVVTYHDVRKGHMFVQDRTAGIYVYAATNLLTNLVNHRVEVNGESAPGLFAPMVEHARVDDRDIAAPWRPAHPSIESVMTGQQDSQLVELTGVVRNIVTNDNQLIVRLASGGTRFDAIFPAWTAPPPASLVDSAVRVRGVCGAVYNSARQMTGFLIFVQRLEDISVEQQSDPAVQSFRPIASVLSFDPGAQAVHRIRVQGVVTFCRPGRPMFVRDQTGSMLIEVPTRGAYQRGDRVEVVGFPAMSTFKPMLEDATVALVAHAAPLSPVRAEVERFFEPDSEAASAEAAGLDGELVTLSGVLQGRIRRDGEDVLVIQNQGRVFYAFAPLRSTTLRDKSELLLTGVCQLRREAGTPATTLRLWVQSDGDITVVRQPPWWTLRHVAILFAALGILLLGVAGWATLLRRQVRKRTTELAATNVQLRGEVSTRQHHETQLQAKTQLLEQMAGAMTCYLATQNWSQSAALLLRAAIRITQSESGFTGVVVNGVLRMLAFEGVRWDAAAGGEGYEHAEKQFRERGFIELHNIDKLFGRAVKQGDIVIANEISAELSVAGPRTLPGHPPLKRLLVVPIRAGKEVVGIIALANRSEPYTDADQQRVEDICRIAGLLYDSYRHSEREGSLQEQLRQAQKMEAIGQLAAGIAHDFNNLLTVIRGRAELLTMVLPTGVAGDAGREISAAAERAANLTRQLLAFSRKQTLELRSVDLNTLVQNLSRMLHRLLREDISIQLHFAAALPPVEGDGGMIEQVVLNLAVNARDAMLHGGSLTLETSCVVVDEEHASEHPQARTGQFACLSVSDTGFGMGPEVLAHLFEPFFTTKEVGKGTGLGLATVYGIVQQHNGWIEVRSAKGQGTRFQIFFPVQKNAVAADTEVSFNPLAVAGTETVLVVEDEPGVRELVRGVLQRFGYRVLLAHSGLDALGVWDTAGGHIDLIVTDVVMPEGISGVDLASRLLRRKPSLRVILTSGYNTHTAEIETQLRAGVEFLAKPYQIQELAGCVRRCLDARSEIC